MLKFLSKTWVRLVISAGLMALILGWLVDLRAAGQALVQARWEYLAWLAVWITADRVLMSYKWRLLLTCRGVAMGHWEALRAYYLASFAGCFLPSTVGADVMRISAVAGPGRPAELITASVVMERALGFLAAIIAAVLAVILLAHITVDLPSSVFWWSLGLLAACLVILGLSLSRRPADWLRARSQSLKRGNLILAWAGKFLSAYGDFREHRGVLAWFLILSIIEQAGPVVGTWLAALAFNIELSLLESAAVAPVALLFTRIPISLSGFGVVEGLYVAFFALVGLGPTDSFLLGLIANLSILVTTIPGGFFYATGGFRMKRERLQTRGEE